MFIENFFDLINNVKFISNYVFALLDFCVKILSFFFTGTNDPVLKWCCYICLKIKKLKKLCLFFSY